MIEPLATAGELARPAGVAADDVVEMVTQSCDGQDVLGRRRGDVGDTRDLEADLGKILSSLKGWVLSGQFVLLFSSFSASVRAAPG